MRASLIIVLTIHILTGVAYGQSQPPLEAGSPEAAFAGGPIRLSKSSAALLRAHFKGDNVPIVPQPFRGKLDTALAARDWPRVDTLKTDLRTARGIEIMLLWEQSRFIATGGIGIAEMHALDMAATGSSGMSETVAMLWLYAVAVTMTDGHECADEAAKDAHLELLMGPVFDKATQIVRTLPDDRLAAMRDLAIRLETVLAADRTDDTMCRVGAVKPEIKPAAEWKPAAAVTRGMLAQHLTALCAVMRPKSIARMEPPKLEPVKLAQPVAKMERAKSDAAMSAPSEAGQTTAAVVSVAPEVPRSESPATGTVVELPPVAGPVPDQEPARR
jgi:hypothetical protein